MKNPFSHGSVEAKVPDGKASSSVGSRESSAGVLEFNRRRASIMLTPNFTSPYMWTYLDGGDNVMEVLGRYGDRAMHCFGYVAPFVTKNLESPIKWRLVSAGMRITLVDNSEGRDGWFEAIRTDSSYTKYMTWREQVGLPQGEDRRFCCNFDVNLQEPGFDEVKWTDSPTYVCGLLKEIDDVLFYLQSRGDRNFQNIPSNWRGVGANYVVDSNFDTVLVRIYTGSDVDPTVPNQPLNNVKIMVNCIHNFEMVHEVRNTYAKYHTKSLCDQAAVQEQDREIRRDIRAGITHFR
jgi:hypothetical protein